MSDDSGSDSSNNSSNDSQDASSEVYQAINSAQKSDNTKEATGTESGISQKAGNKNPSGGNEVPSADEVSIPSSVDPDAPANTEGDNSDDSE